MSSQTRQKPPWETKMGSGMRPRDLKNQITATPEPNSGMNDTMKAKKKEKEPQSKKPPSGDHATAQKTGFAGKPKILISLRTS